MRGRDLSKTVGGLAVLALAVSAGTAVASCESPEAAVSLQDVVDRFAAGGVRYAFVGERHGSGPVKRFAVDLANALVDRGESVGLYVEGFRVDCSPDDDSCPSLAWVFNGPAFLALLDHSRAPVHPIDPVERDNRAARMASAIAAGSESIKIVLVGASHVVHAGEPEAVHLIYGGAAAYPDPGDVAEAFPRAEVLTFSLEPRDDAGSPYALRSGGCGADYVVTALPTRAY